MIKASGTADVYSDFSGLAKLRGQAKENSPQALREAARQFESVFVQMALKSMRQATQESTLMNTEQTKAYRDMYDQQLGLELSKHSKLGFSDMLVRQLGGQPGKDGTALTGKTVVDYRREALPAIRSGASHLNEEHAQAVKLIDRLTSASPASPVRVASVANDGKAGFDGPEDFVATLWPEAQRAAAELGVDPKMLLAQAALESGWGKSLPRTADGQSSHNLFGIKADRSWVGQSIANTTLEYEGGAATKTRAAFRSYDSYADSFRDYVHFLRANPRYADALQNTDNPERFIAGLQKAGYATDPSYARKVLSIYHGHEAFEGLDVT
ncbi:flagellar assembly peptidoglycan hydrolase FlgJ [Methylococcus sp. EFPC2]|uniref:flagellar assembly peptidoglycan hydrolase FlgJ n=1 Tax=Methylococcus sp. EFPC2 TaxID=2812648 RepID=UPI00196744D5|nr:flagellar assembly peptidoglycan hydrolase FlgJ [Methylococcus sp. EFPC2]QSA98367.1 flagellar assembly peptidoglycan hydrolase FlgJ [Methylococcus sp. EFPC2]